MATRIRRQHSDEVRAKIQASQIINRLVGHVDGKIEMTNSQVRAALGLLSKVVPDLAAIQHSGEVAHRHFAVSDTPEHAPEEWDQQHATIQ